MMLQRKPKSKLQSLCVEVVKYGVKRLTGLAYRHPYNFKTKHLKLNTKLPVTETVRW